VGLISSVIDAPLVPHAALESTLAPTQAIEHFVANWANLSLEHLVHAFVNGPQLLIFVSKTLAFCI